MPRLTNYQKLKIYLKQPLSLFGIILIIVGTGFLFITDSTEIGNEKFIICPLMLIAGGYLVWIQFKKVLLAAKAIERGKKTIATITAIGKTNMTHNDRTVKRYTFEFEVEKYEPV